VNEALLKKWRDVRDVNEKQSLFPFSLLALPSLSSARFTISQS
jgi:hypothetical protein